MFENIGINLCSLTRQKEGQVLFKLLRSLRNQGLGHEVILSFLDVHVFSNCYFLQVFFSFTDHCLIFCKDVAQPAITAWSNAAVNCNPDPPNLGE